MPLTPTVLSSSWVYRNPSPHLRAINAFHPNLCQLPDDTWITTFDVGQGAESMDYHTVLARSADGESWHLEGPILPLGTEDPACTHSIRAAALGDGRLAAIGARFHRQDPNEGILNRKTMGLCKTDLIWTESFDQGRSWAVPRIIFAPLAGEAWEVSHCPLDLGNGLLGAPLAAWRNWDGHLPDGEQSVLLLSRDGGKTWPEFRRTFDGRKSGIIYWEQCVIPFGGGQLAVAWAYDPIRQITLPSVYSIADKLDAEFSAPRPTGFLAETCEILFLGGNDLLAVYRRTDEPGLWAETATVVDGTWTRHRAVPLWQGARSDMTGSANSAEALSSLKFGSPNMKRMRDGTTLVVFWCQEDGQTGIRWLKLRLE